MAVRIRLMRLGKIRNPQYRIVIADSRKKRDGRAIEEIGLYHPKEDPSRIEVNSERAQYWLSVGAQPSQPVQRLLELTGDWQKHKGLPAPPPLKVAEPKADKHARYEAEAKAVAVSEEKTAEKKKPAKKAAKSAKAEAKTDEKAKTDSKAKAEAKTDEKAKTDSKAKAEAKTDEKAKTEGKAEKADKPAKSEGKAKAKKAESKPAESEESAGAETGSES